MLPVPRWTTSVIDFRYPAVLSFSVNMKLKQVYKIVFTSCGILFLIAGVACFVVGMLLQYDSQRQQSIESLSRVYSTQYWLGLPVRLNKCGFFSTLYKRF